MPPPPWQIEILAPGFGPKSPLCQQRPRRHGGQLRDAMAAGRPDCARCDPGRQSTARLHPSPRRSFHGGRNAARPAHNALRVCGHQSRCRRRHLGRCDKESDATTAGSRARANGGFPGGNTEALEPLECAAALSQTVGQPAAVLPPPFVPQPVNLGTLEVHVSTAFRHSL
jgi:hypothetical protein